MTRGPSRIPRTLACVLALGWLGCATDAQVSISDAPLVLEVGVGEESSIDEVTYVITGSDMDPIDGVIDVSAPGATASVEVFGIAPGTGYLVTMQAEAGDFRCEGSSRFDVAAGSSSIVHVMLGCKRAPRLGGVRVDGALNVCANLDKVIASPLQTSTGNGLALSASGTDAEGDAIEYRWTATGGSFSDASTAVTEYRCEEAGDQLVEVEVSDDGFVDCLDSWRVAVRCVLSGAGGDPTPALESSDPTSEGLVVTTAWLRLTFAAPVSEPALQTLALDCDGVSQAATLHRLGTDGRSIIVNPADALPYDARCSLEWRGPNGPESLPFMTHAEVPREEVSYDLTDATRSVPFPDDAYLVPDETTLTGGRVDVPIPDRPRGLQRVLASLKFAIGASDGFSPLSPIVLELSAAAAPGGVPNTPTQSLDPLATVGLYDIDPASPSYGERVPFELYTRSAASKADPLPQHALVLFPSIPLTPTGQYAVVVTNRALAEVDQPFEASAFMSAALGSPEDEEPDEVSSTRDRVRDALTALTNASPPVFADDIALLVRFTVRSTDDFALTPLAMREDVEALGPPTYEITSIRPGFGRSVAALVEGTWEAPEWREGVRIKRDTEGLPVQTGTKQIPFILALPESAIDSPAPITIYQHGNPGSAQDEVPFHADAFLAEGGFAVIGFTDAVNREVGQDLFLQRIAQLSPLLVQGVPPEYDMQTTGEQLSFVRLTQELGDLDVLPLGAPDGVPDLDVSAPLTYDGISEGANKAQAFVPYAPEVAAASLVAGGARRAEILFYQDPIHPDGVGSPLLDSVTIFAPNIRPIDLWLGLSLYQMAFDHQDPQNHLSFAYTNPVEIDGTFKKPSVLVQEGIGDTLIPNNATRSLVYALGGTPLIDPIAQPVPYLPAAEAPVVANVDAETTSAYAQYVPNGLPDLLPSPGCEFWFEGHFCPQVAPAALDQRLRFFQSALTDRAPTIDVGEP